MRAARLIFLMLGCAAAVSATGAARAVTASQQAPSRSAADTVGNRSREADHAVPAGDPTLSGKTPDAQQSHPKVSGKKAPAAKASLSKPSRRNEFTNKRERSASEDSKNSHGPGSDKPAGAAQNGLARNETVNHAPSHRAPSAVRPAVPALSTMRHRGANPAIVGGAGNSNTRNTTALDGTHMSRRHIGN